MPTVLFVHLSKAGRFFVVRAYENINNLIFHGQCRYADFAFVSVAGELWVEGIALEAHCLAFIYAESSPLSTLICKTLEQFAGIVLIYPLKFWAFPSAHSNMPIGAIFVYLIPVGC